MLHSDFNIKYLYTSCSFAPSLCTYFHPVYGHSSESLIPSPSYYFLKIVSDIFTLNKKWARELQNPFPARSWIALQGPIVFFHVPTRLNRFLWKSSILPFNICFPVNICIDISSTLSSLLGIWCNIFSCFKNVNFFHRIFSENLFIKPRNTS